MATIIDPEILAVLHKKNDRKGSRYLSTMKQDTEISIKWHFTGGKELVEVSSITSVDSGGNGCGGGGGTGRRGGRSRRSRRGRHG